MLTNDGQWLRPNVTDWYSMLVGKEKVYNTGFEDGVGSLGVISNSSQSMIVN